VPQEGCAAHEPVLGRASQPANIVSLSARKGVSKGSVAGMNIRESKSLVRLMEKVVSSDVLAPA
jgi:hypothetical protein